MMQLCNCLQCQGPFREFIDPGNSSRVKDGLVVFDGLGTGEVLGTGYDVHEEVVGKLVFVVLDCVELLISLVL